MTSAGPQPPMLWVPGGVFLMGSDEHYPEERPASRVAVDGFWIDQHPVTNAEFGRFVEASGYVTLAERPPDPSDFPGVPVAFLVPGSLVFQQPSRPVSLHTHSNWWAYVPGACWRHPQGPGSSLVGREDHPVVHVVLEDAAAYAAWAGKVLPTEAEWGFAARGGLDGAAYTWGDEADPGGQAMANTWQGAFPWQNLATDGYERTSPVGVFPANGYGLHDMAGNVWEWTSDDFAPRRGRQGSGACCVPRNPRVTAPVVPGEVRARHVIKGGSHLCAPNYCLRYRPAARQGQEADSSTSHLGFRPILRPG